MIGLLLDDERDAETCFHMTGKHEYLQVDWDVVKSYDEFVKYINLNGVPKIISFDNDLRMEHYRHAMQMELKDFNFNLFSDTGYHCMQYMFNYIKENNLPTPLILVHTQNPYANRKMVELMLLNNKQNNEIK